MMGHPTDDLKIQIYLNFLSFPLEKLRFILSFLMKMVEVQIILMLDS